MENNTPVVKKKLGRFQVSIWKRKKLYKARNDYEVEREVEIVRACIQYSKFNKITNTWSNQAIWCDPHELRNIVQLLDEVTNYSTEQQTRGEIQCAIHKYMQ